MGGMIVLAYDATPTGYYLPRGYKVEAEAATLGCGIWPGDYVGGIVGVSTENYKVLVVGKCEKAWNGGVWDGFKVYWIEGGREEEKAQLHIESDQVAKPQKITIVYGYDGMVKISINDRLIYSFTGTVDKYSIVAQDAKVSAPEPLPQDGSDSGTGEGYNPPSVSELQVQYLLLGAGATAIAVPVIYMFVKGGRGRRKAKANMAILLIIMIIMGMIAITTYYVYRTVTTPFHILPLTEEIGDKPILVTLQFGQITPGQVYEIVADKQGWQIKEKDTRLYEKLELTNIDLSVNDVVTVDLYDWYFDGQNDYVHVSDLSVGTEYTAIVWFRMTDISDKYILDWRDKETGHYIISFTKSKDTTDFKLIVTDVNDTSYSIDLDLGSSWNNLHYACLRVTSTKMSMKIDDMVVEQSFSETEFGGTGNLYIFRHYWGGDKTAYTAGTVAQLLLYNREDEISTSYNDYVISASGLVLFLDPTFYNGTHYIDIINNIVGTPHGVTRVPAEKPHLWLIKNLESDNKLHFMYFPEGTIVRIKDSSGNVIREFIITGARAGNTTQVLDYTVSLDTTTLVGATVEAFVPSNKVRVYAPSSSYVAILGEDGAKYGVYAVGADGYVDIPLAKSLKNAYIVVYADEERDSGLNIDVKDLGGGRFEVKVYNDRGVLIPGLLVRLVDPANVVLDYNVTDESGTVELDAGRPLPEATIYVDGIWDGTIYRLSKTVSLAESMSGEEQEPTTSSSSNTYKYLLLGLFLIIVLAIALVMVRRR